jgi:hypothetical protein
MAQGFVYWNQGDAMRKEARSIGHPSERSERLERIYVLISSMPC